MPNPPTSLFRTPIESADGTFLAFFSERGLCRLDFPGRKSPPAADAKAPAKIQSWQRQTEQALRRCLAGQKPAALPPLDTSGSEFQQAVWRVLSAITPGQTMTYAQVACAVKRPLAARAVGQACGANPIPVLIPCHRVLAAGGGVGGFSGGLNWKRRLLEREGIAPKT